MYSQGFLDMQPPASTRPPSFPKPDTVPAVVQRSEVRKDFNSPSPSPPPFSILLNSSSSISFFVIFQVCICWSCIWKCHSSIYPFLDKLNLFRVEGEDFLLPFPQVFHQDTSQLYIYFVATHSLFQFDSPTLCSHFQFPQV